MRTSGQKLPKVVSVVLFVLCCNILLTSAATSTGKTRIRRPISLKTLHNYYEDTQRSDDATGRNLLRNWLRLRNFFVRKKNRLFNTTPTTTSFLTNIASPSPVFRRNVRDSAEDGQTNIDDKLGEYDETYALYDGYQRPYNNERVKIRQTMDNYSNPTQLRKTTARRKQQQKIRNSNNNIGSNIANNRPLNRFQSLFDNTFRRQTPIIYKY